ncbi:hypothetical protein AGR4B_Cc90070 [Agrobacterium tumefaciens str. CFBP 5621]|nr:hypothetical protein AGR4B_Cc90070 [Agrobacterium tumefaciens str. CFBP 5621]
MTGCPVTSATQQFDRSERPKGRTALWLPSLLWTANLFSFTSSLRGNSVAAGFSTRA